VTRLKLDVTQVTVLGDPVGVTDMTNLVWSSERAYRRLSVRAQRIVAAICVGEWEELAILQTLVTRKRKVSRAALARFAREGSLGLSGSAQATAELSDTMVVCQCANVTCGVLRGAIANGHRDAAALSRATGAATLCGSCQPVLVALTSGGTAPAPAGGRVFGWAAAAALILALTTLAAPRVPLAKSVLDATVDFLFTHPLAKQISGFGILAVVTVGLLFSLRKRISRFQWSSYARLRVWHGVLGALALVGLLAHTGFRLGSNFNLALSLTFLTSALTGALAALLGRVEQPNVRPVSVLFRRAHEITFWPLPVLVLFHALKTYYF
jgi:nitrite reductase (NADH) large subunit